MTEGRPKFRELADDLETRIRAGEFEPGARLPSKAHLMDSYRQTFSTVALGTLDKSFSLLRERGLIETRRGSGTYVCDPLPDPAAPAGVDLLAEVRALAEEVRQLKAENLQMVKRIAVLEQAVQNGFS